MNYATNSYGLEDHIARLRSERTQKDKARRNRAEKHANRRDCIRASARYNHIQAVWYQVAFWNNRL